MKHSIYIFLFFFPLYVLSMGGHGYGGVGTTTYDVTRAILLHKSFAISPVPWGKFGNDGQFYAQYGIGHSLYNIPFYSLGHLLTTFFPALSPQYERMTMFSTLLGQPCIAALTCALLFALCRKLQYSLKTSLYCTIFYGVGAQVWMYAQLDFSEPILTFFLLGTVYWIYVPEKTFEVSKTSEAIPLMLAGLFFGIAVTVKIVALILLPVFLVYLLQTSYPKMLSHHVQTPGDLPDNRGLSAETPRLKPVLSEAEGSEVSHRVCHEAHLPQKKHLLVRSIKEESIRRVGLFILPLVVFGIGTIAWYNFIRFGTPFETGYDHEFNFYYKHALQQFWNNLGSLEGSIFLYSPVIVLALFGVFTFYKQFKTFALLIFGIILTFFLFYPFTNNELYYGPRYLTPTLPFFMLIAGTTFAKVLKSSQGLKSLKLRKLGIGALLLLGILQQLLGVVVNYHTYYWRIQYTMPAVDNTIRLSPVGEILLSTPNLPHILGHLWLVKYAVLDLVQPGGLPFTGVQLLSDSTQHNAWIPYYGIDLWWCNPNVVRMAGWIGPGIIIAACISVMSLALYTLMKNVG